ncbi:MAG: PaaI family thioesterase [Acidimicrobiales bacterium]
MNEQDDASNRSGDPTAAAGGAGSEPDAVGDHELLAAAAVRRLGHALAQAKVDPPWPAGWPRSRTRWQTTWTWPPPGQAGRELPTVEPLHRLLEGRMPDPTPDGAPIEFDRFSIVGGAYSPIGLAASHHREGDEAVTTLVFNSAYEGPPGRAHGGSVALVIDEATATVLPMVGRFGFTGSVSLRLLKPAPLDVEVQFRSKVVGEEGRKLFVHCTGIGPEGVFAEAEAVYIQVDPATVPWIVAARAARNGDRATTID